MLQERLAPCNKAGFAGKRACDPAREDSLIARASRPLHEPRAAPLDRTRRSPGPARKPSLPA
jgi:hypothetical protein